MKLLHVERAFIRSEKITRYLLSEDHPIGRHKARFFVGFGFSLSSWQQLETALLQHASQYEVVQVETTPFGFSYAIDGPLLTPNGRNPQVKTVWFRTNRTLLHYGSSLKEGKMINELNCIVLTTDLPEYGLTAGDIGTVVMVHQHGQGFEVEFVALDGETLAIASLPASQIRPVIHREIAHARSLAIA